MLYEVITRGRRGGLHPQPLPGSAGAARPRDDPIAETIPSPTRAMMVSSVAPPIRSYNFV